MSHGWKERMPTTPPDRLTPDPDLHLVLEDGVLIRPARWQGTHALFMLSQIPSHLWVLSRLNSQFPWFEQRGVLIGDITFYDEGGTHRLTKHLLSPKEGWGPGEGHSARWTSGRARLDFDAPHHWGGVILSIEVRSVGPYHLIAPEPPQSV